MIKCIVGLKGSGKTKQLIHMVNTAVEHDHGSVICIEKDPILTYDINHKCRLINTCDYELKGYEEFYGFICGLYAQNYDITSVFVDGLLKIAGSRDLGELERFIARLEKFEKKTGINFVLSVSADIEDLPEGVKKYV